MQKIILLDDDENILFSVSVMLKSYGYDVSTFSDGFDMLEYLNNNNSDILILDIKMPRIDGLEVFNSVRKFSNIPIIFLTSKDSEVDELIGLRLGADDYIRKPFSQKLLVERIKSVLRRSNSNENKKEHKDVTNLKYLELNRETFICKWKDKIINLTSTEFLILESLIKRPGSIRTRDDLINDAFKEGFSKEDRVIDSHIKRIRQKFISMDPNFDLIKTIYGVGYKIQ